jgi:hypothetical protein
MSLLAAFALAASTATAPILLDGRCDEPQWHTAASTDIGAGATLHVLADDANVYLCIALPPESQGTFDLYVATPDGAQTALHSSAQTGERTRGPSGWNEGGFNNHVDWYAPPIPFEGMSRNAQGQLRPDFANVPARELHLRRSRFGGDAWRYMIEVRRLTAENVTTTYPANANSENASAWSTLTLP